MGNRYLECEICGKRRDEKTRACPTPEACDKMRAPTRRRLRAERGDTARVEAAEREAASMGVSRVPALREDDTAQAVERAGRGWRTRRTG